MSQLAQRAEQTDVILKQACDQLVAEGWIAEKDLKYAQRLEQKGERRWDEILINAGLLSEQTLLRTLSQMLMCRFWEADALNKNVERVPRDIVPESMIREHSFLPLYLDREQSALAIIVSRLPSGVFLDRLCKLVEVDQIVYEFATSSAIAGAIFQMFRFTRQDSPKEEEDASLAKCPKCQTPYDPEDPELLACSNCGEILRRSLKSHELPLGSIIGRFQIDGLVAKGGMAEVYRATDLKTGESAALKLLQSQVVLQKNAIQRFQREAQTLRQVQHPGIVRLLAFGFQEGIGLYIATELLRGREFLEVLQDESPIPLSRMAPIVVQIADALDYAHRHDVIHRDLKPDNIILIKDRERNTEYVKLIDFGLAKDLGDSQRLTQDGLALGTPRYMSPEQAASSELDLRTDIYSLTVILYESLTGRPLFDVRGSYQMMMHHLQATPLPLNEKRPDIEFPEALVRLVAEGLSKEPEKRPSSMAQFKRRFLRAIGAKDAPGESMDLVMGALLDAPSLLQPELSPIQAQLHTESAQAMSQVDSPTVFSSSELSGSPFRDEGIVSNKKPSPPKKSWAGSSLLRGDDAPAETKKAPEEPTAPAGSQPLVDVERIFQHKSQSPDVSTTDAKQTQRGAPRRRSHIRGPLKDKADIRRTKPSTPFKTSVWRRLLLWLPLAALIGVASYFIGLYAF